jgi:hypothetical protein
VKIIELGGGGAGALASGAGANGTAGRADGLVDALFAYRAQSPVIDRLLKEAGFTTLNSTRASAYWHGSARQLLGLAARLLLIVLAVSAFRLLDAQQRL